jgi:hypothetical protein
MQNLKFSNKDILDLNSLKKYVDSNTHEKWTDINDNEFTILAKNLSYYLVLFKMRNIISQQLYNNILLVFKNFKNSKIKEETITKIEESLSNNDITKARTIFEREIFTIKGGKRKTSKRKTSKRKTKKRKTNKRKTKKYYGGVGGEDDEDDEEPQCNICLEAINNGDSTIIHYPLTSSGERDMNNPHVAHRTCVEGWMNMQHAAKYNNNGVRCFECPQCSVLLEPQNIVDDGLRNNFENMANAANVANGLDGLNDDELFEVFNQAGEFLINIEQAREAEQRRNNRNSDLKVLVLALIQIFVLTKIYLFFTTNMRN